VGRLAGVQMTGYEIHHGQTHQHPAMAKAGDMARAVLPGGLGWQNGAGNVLGLYLHGLFEDPCALQACLAIAWPGADAGCGI
jgi:adenosylcobyric acid synthase